MVNKTASPYNPAKWTVECQLGVVLSDAFAVGFATEAEARRCFARQVAAAQSAPTTICRVAIWHQHVILTSHSGRAPAGRVQAPKPQVPQGAEPIIRFLPARSRALRPFRFHDSPEALDL